MSFGEISQKLAIRPVTLGKSGQLSYYSRNGTTVSPFKTTNNSFPYINSSGVLSSLTGTSAIPYFNASSNITTMTGTNVAIYFNSSGAVSTSALPLVNTDYYSNYGAL